MCPGILYSICWFLIFLFLAWPFAFFIAGWYVWFLPWTICIPDCKGLTDAIFKLLQLPVKCIENCKGQKPLC